METKGKYDGNQGSGRREFTAGLYPLYCRNCTVVIALLRRGGGTSGG